MRIVKKLRAPFVALSLAFVILGLPLAWREADRILELPKEARTARIHEIEESQRWLINTVYTRVWASTYDGAVGHGLHGEQISSSSLTRELLLTVAWFPVAISLVVVVLVPVGYLFIAALKDRHRA